MTNQDLIQLFLASLLGVAVFQTAKHAVLSIYRRYNSDHENLNIKAMMDKLRECSENADEWHYTIEIRMEQVENFAATTRKVTKEKRYTIAELRERLNDYADLDAQWTPTEFLNWLNNQE